MLLSPETTITIYDNMYLAVALIVGLLCMRRVYRMFRANPIHDPKDTVANTLAFLIALISGFVLGLIWPFVPILILLYKAVTYKPKGSE